MIKLLSRIIYKIFKFFDRILIFLTKKSFIDLVDDEFYLKKSICSKMTYFYIPNPTTQWRSETILTKEPETIDWIDSFNTENEILFWDIGANVGLYSIYAAQKYKNIKVHSFEPSTNNLRILSRNVSINNLSNKIIINQIPLSNGKEFYSNMYEEEFIEGWSMGSFGEATDHEGKEFKFKQKYKMLGLSVDFLIRNKILEVPDYIKIDVDGIEHKILEGSELCFNNENLKSISVELNENYKNQFDVVNKIMAKFDFRLKHRKRNEKLYNTKKFLKTYNYIFERK